jgi:hypothetical protein
MCIKRQATLRSLGSCPARGMTHGQILSDISDLRALDFVVD